MKHRPLQSLTLHNLLYEGGTYTCRVNQTVLASLLLRCPTIAAAALGAVHCFLLHRGWCLQRSAALHNDWRLLLNWSCDGTLGDVEEVVELAAGHVGDVLLLHLLDDWPALRESWLLGAALSTSALLNCKLVTGYGGITTLHRT